MHELSIVEALIRQCEEEAKKNNASLVDEVYVKIGRLSGVEVDLFQRCFETFKENSLFCKEAALFLDIADITVACVCGFEGILENNVFLCPKCKSKDLKIIDGEELYLMRLCMS